MFSNIRPRNVEDFIEIIIMKPTALVVSLFMLFMRISRNHHDYKTNRSCSPLTFGGGCVQWLDYLSGEPTAVKQWAWYHLVDGLSSCTLFSVGATILSATRISR